MYTMTYNGEILHDPRENDRKCISASCSLSTSSAGSLKFKTSPFHPLYGKMEAMNCDKEVVLYEGETEIFRGRIINNSEEMNTCTEFECQGQLGYLNDSIVRPYGTYEDTSSDPQWSTIAPSEFYYYLSWLIQNHNDTTEGSKAFYIGEINISPTMVCSSTNYPTTGTEIKNQIIDVYDCIIEAKMIDGYRYLFITDNGGAQCNQRIEFGENILDYTSKKDASSVVTDLIPVGTDSDNKSIYLSSIMDGVYENCTKIGDHIMSSEGVLKYGVITQKVAYSYATTVDELLEYAIADLASLHTIEDTMTITAIDLSMIDKSIGPIFLNNWVRVTSKPHNVDQYMMCSAIDINILDPTQTKYTFGSQQSSLTSESRLKAARIQVLAEKAIQQGNVISDEAKAAAKEAAKASDAAAEAKTIAVSKSMNYTSQPTPPYNVGDTWTDLTNNIVYTCYTSRLETEEFNKSDWCETGKAGKDAALVCVVSRNGEAFKNNEVETTLDVTIFYGGKTITTKTELSNSFGSAASLKWLYCPKGSKTYYELSSTDSRLSNDGFTLVISPSDVDQQIVFRCELDDGK